MSFSGSLLFHQKKSKLKISEYKYFCYILKLVYTGCQWKELVIEKDEHGNHEIHYTSIFRRFKIWNKDGLWVKSFEASVCLLQNRGLLDTDILHGDGTTTAAKKGGDNIGRSGHKKLNGEKIVAISDRNGNVVSPFVTAPGNRNEIILLKPSLDGLSKICKLANINILGSVMSLDAGYDSVSNRKAIFNRGMIPNIKDNKRSRKTVKKGRKRIYSEEIFQERFHTIERTFAWEDKFKRLLLRFERISDHHFGMKMLAYTLINLRHFC
jgi:transposase